MALLGSGHAGGYGQALHRDAANLLRFPNEAQTDQSAAVTPLARYVALVFPTELALIRESTDFFTAQRQRGWLF